jgi:hypothetical protein
VWLVRQASRHPKCGKYIGRVCSSAVSHAGSPAWPCGYHPENDTTIEGHMPHLVTPMMTMWGVEVDLDPQLPDELCGEADEQDEA